MKRENKAYSFKEQIIELELKEEIKKKKGIKEEIQLTSKQKEMLTAQLEKESQMRKQLKELDTELESTLGLFDAVLKRNPPSLSQYIPALVGCFLPLLKSPLAAPRIKAPFLSLVSCVMPDHLKTFGTVASHVTLRMMKPECDLDESWCQEDLPTAVNRVIGLLHTHTVPTRITKGEEGPMPLSAPAFSLVFPLLKMVLLETTNDSEEKEELMVKVLQIITVHAQLRSSTNDENWLVDEVKFL
ncbi:PREDICTED: translational activator GCN1-like [Thamnophis sirtalis]|uniref:Translational activator GCN1-like n=1 Tax=Thamnophis sirtalis TaxID=35019 RepID=A0A6I9YL69_9SAUR|nr:PREDICTED: translational activator GCN1-like [Thamnophis sirtalis]